MVFLGCVFLIVSCKTEKRPRMTTELATNFSYQNIEDIDKIVSYVETKLKSHYKTKNIDKAYNAFVTEYLPKNFNHIDSIFTPDELQKLLSSIHRETFNKIWSYEKVFSSSRKDSTQRMSLAFQKKYIKYLAVLGENDTILKEYVKYVDYTGASTNFFTPPLLVSYTKGSWRSQPPKTFGDYNARVYRSIYLVELAKKLHTNKKFIKAINARKQKEAQSSSDE